MSDNVSRNEVDRMIDSSNQGKFFFLGVLVGALIGGTLALLYAPAKGSDTRRFIKDKAEDAARLAMEKAEDYRERAIEVAEDVRGKAEETIARGEAALRSVKEPKS